MSEAAARAVRIGVLGAAGSFSEEAALAYAEEQEIEVELARASSFEELVRSLDRGAFERIVLPVANSTTGPVLPALAALAQSSAHPLAGLVLGVRHALLAKDAGVRAAELRAVASHPQALAQCRRFLESFAPRLAERETSDTAQAARALSLGALGRECAVIASRRAAEVHGLHVLQADVQDEPENRTSFVVLESAGARGASAIEDLRARIQALDAAALETLARRFRLVEELGEAKSRVGMPIDDPTRERELEAHYRELAGKLGLDAGFVLRLFATVFGESKRLQARVERGG
jgi:prephenate dehydratase